MKPKEKAIELTDKYLQCIIFNIKQQIKVSVIKAAKECAIIYVNEKLTMSNYTDYWQEVKKELELL